MTLPPHPYWLCVALAIVQSPASAATLPATVPSPPAHEPPLRCPLDAPYDGQNPFTRIMRGELPASMVYEDNAVFAFLPLEWEHPGHVLVIPRRAVRSVHDMTEAE